MKDRAVCIGKKSGKGKVLYAKGAEVYCMIGKKTNRCGIVGIAISGQVCEVVQ
jgi:hypothetical protein